MASGSIFGIIIYKLGYGQKLSLIVLLEIDEGLEVSFHYTILSFNLPVSLQMDGGSKPMLDTKEVAKQWPEFQSKKRASIDNNWVWKGVVMHYHVYYNLYKLECINSNLYQFVMDHLCEPITYNYITVPFPMD